MNDDTIEKIIELKASPSRVWRALTNHEEFGTWFQVRLDQPFVEGGESTGVMTYPEVEGMPWIAYVERIEPETLFSFSWHAATPDFQGDLSKQPKMLVEFRLQPIQDGTRLTVTESGFSSLQDPLRLEMLRSNRKGWDLVAEAIGRYVET